jgi:hypothetical protein
MSANDQDSQTPGGFGAGVVGQDVVDRERAHVHELEETFGEAGVAAIGLRHAVKLLAWGKTSGNPAPKLADTIEEIELESRRKPPRA